MTQQLTPHRVVAERMKDLRKKRGWSAAHLASELQHEGIPWDRSIVASFELGRRASVTVEELLGLAYVLGVSPLHLLVPPDQQGKVEFYAVTPEGSTPVPEVLDWMRGDEYLNGQHSGWFREEAERYGEH
jgi:transcriptional regulator with XRE-family HTH domain